MSRVVKDADVRRKELLDTALRLFARTGYESTSVDQITGEVGVAKGTFYHYFSSKQDLLEQIVDAWVGELFAHLEHELSDFQGDAAAKFRAWFTVSTEWKLADVETSVMFARTLYSDENLRLRNALWSNWLVRMGSDLVSIITQGVAEGVFTVADPEATTSIIMSIWVGWAETHVDVISSLLDDPEKLRRVAADMSAMETALERILGVPEGTLQLHSREYVERVGETRSQPGSATETESSNTEGDQVD
jgi:AcrR family transcriptional regulator